MSIANTGQAEHWNTGPGVAHWVANQARYDRMHAPFTALILDAAALRPGGTVLDVGCGCGGTTLAAARLVAPGQALGLDLSGPMLARARADAEAAGLGNAVFRQGDAQVEPLEPGRFDTVISRFGVMFFADPVAAFANISSATRAGGRLVFACWQPLAANQWMLVPGAALAEHLPPPAPAPAGGPGMFAFADPDRLRPILAAAGWRIRERRRRGRVPAYRDAGPDHARRGRRRHGRPRARVRPGRADPVCRRRRRAPRRRRLARPGGSALTAGS